MIEAAIELFASRGYTKTTLVQIGRLAGCTGTLISNRFGSKEGLLRAVLAHIMSRFALDQRSVEHLEAVFMGAPPAAPRPDGETGPLHDPATRKNSFEVSRRHHGEHPSAESLMRDFVQTYLEDAVRKQSRIRALHVIMGEALGALPEIQIEIAKVDGLFRDRVALFISKGVKSGEYRADLDIAGASIVVVGMLRGITTQTLVEPEVVRLEDLIPFVQDAVVACLKDGGRR